MLPTHKLVPLIILVAALGGQVYGRQSVVLQLRWDHQFQFAGYYAALWNGYYDEVGLDVEIRSAIVDAGTVVSAVDEVVEGRADFGIGATDIAYSRARGAPLVITASVFQRSATAFFSRPGLAVRTPADLVGLRVSRRLGDMVDIEFQAMLLAEGIDPSAVEPFRFDQSKGYLAGFYSGDLDVIPGYVIGTPHEGAELGMELGVLRPIDYGVDFYGDSLFTTERLVQRDPKLVEDFTAASLRGWRYALENPDDVAERIIQSFSPRFPIENWPGFVRFQIQPVQKLTLHEVIEIGNVNPARWRRMHEMLVDLGMAEGEFDPVRAIFDPVRLDKERGERTRRIFLLVVGILSFVVAVAAAWIVTLRRTLGAKTRQIVEREAQYRRLVENTSAIVYSRGEGVGSTYYSSVQPILGYSNDELSARPNLWAESVDPKDREVVNEVLHGASPFVPTEVEYRVRHKDGSNRWILDRLYKRISQDGRCVYDGIAIDITRRKEVETQLSEAVDAKDKLMRELNHRVKNNLLLVTSLINLKDESLGPEIDLSDIAHHVSAIRGLHEMLAAGAEVGSINLREYVGRLVSSLFSLASTRVDVVTDVDEVTVPSDYAIHIGLIINELGTNALKYGFGKGGGTFSLTLTRRAGRNELELVVENSGRPIPDDVDLEDPKTLGLRVISALVAQLRATVVIRRAPSPRFEFRIPLPGRS